MFGVRTGVPLICSLLGLLAGACVVENDQSIVDKPLLPDKRLVGVWALEADGGAQVLVLNAEENREHELLATFVLVAKDAPPAPSRAAITFASIGGRAYFEANWKIGEWLPIDPPVRRTFGTYEISGAAGAENLKVCLADVESFEAPIKSGALAGIGGKGNSYERRMVVTSDGAALRAYLANNHFKCEVSATFRRLIGPKQSR